MIAESSAQEASRAAEDKATWKPIKDELLLGETIPPEIELAGGDTIQEESELPGTTHPKRGAGWWGRGPPIRAWRKSVERDFADGARLCSPVRWPIARRRLPNDRLVVRIRETIVPAFEQALKKLKIDAMPLDPKLFLLCLCWAE